MSKPIVPGIVYREALAFRFLTPGRRKDDSAKVILGYAGKRKWAAMDGLEVAAKIIREASERGIEEARRG